MSCLAKTSRALTTLILACCAAIFSSRSAMACSVCYGDPNSPMSKGVEAGVLVLLGVIVTVLVMLASLLIFWMRRAANLGSSPASETAETGRA